MQPALARSGLQRISESGRDNVELSRQYDEVRLSFVSHLQKEKWIYSCKQEDIDFQTRAKNKQIKNQRSASVRFQYFSQSNSDAEFVLVMLSAAAPFKGKRLC